MFKNPIVKVLLAVLAALVVAGFLLASATKKAHAADGFQWKHFGTDPYAATRSEAMKKRLDAFEKMGLPAPLINQLMYVTSKPGEKIRLVNGNKLDAMLSKGGIVHKNVTVAFVKPPVSGKMEYAAPAEQWQTTWEGKVITIILPEICNNWSLIRGPRLPPVKKCVELVFNAPIGGHVRWGIGTVTGPLDPDGCNAQREGDGSWKAWYGDCDICVPALGYIKSVLGSSAQVPHKYLYPVTQVRQTLRFSTKVWDTVVYICLEDANGVKTCGVYMRPQDWQGRYRVEISDSLWVRDEGNCPD